MWFHFSLAVTEHEIKNNALLDKEEPIAYREGPVLNYQMFYLTLTHIILNRKLRKICFLQIMLT